jgi:hypothetical protein
MYVNAETNGPELSSKMISVLRNSGALCENRGSTKFKFFNVLRGDMSLSGQDQNVNIYL